MKKIILTIVILIALISPVITIIKSIQFDQQCGGYLKQAADANSVELALDRFEKALKYIDANNLTDGYTSILWKTEDDNIGFWYQNILTCRDELSEIIAKEDATQLEKSNILMKIRESLMDNSGQGGDNITVPNGISRYPHNFGYAMSNTISILLLLLASFITCYFLTFV